MKMMDILYSLHEIAGGMVNQVERDDSDDELYQLLQIYRSGKKQYKDIDMNDDEYVIEDEK